MSIMGGRWWILLFFLLILAVLAWAVTLLAFAVRAAFRRDWKTSATLLVAFVCSLPLMLLGARSGDYIHLAVMSPYYLMTIHQSPDWQSRAFRFDWGDQAAWVTEGFRGKVLIYDASGKTVVGDRFDPRGTGLTIDVQHFVGNFYLENSDSE